MNSSHEKILAEIEKRSGKPTQHTFLATYLGNSHPRYPISNPVLRAIAKEWMQANRSLPVKDFIQVITSLMEGKSFTEKLMGGFLLDYARDEQTEIPPSYFGSWLEHLEGWAEIDTLCTGNFSKTCIAHAWDRWNPFLLKLSRSKNIAKRRASLVFFCSMLSRPVDPAIAETALEIIDRLKSEKEVLITKAISWVLRSMIRHHRQLVEGYLWKNKASLPAIAVRETMAKLETGRKS